MPYPPLKIKLSWKNYSPQMCHSQCIFIYLINYFSDTKAWSGPPSGVPVWDVTSRTGGGCRIPAATYIKGSCDGPQRVEQTQNCLIRSHPPNEKTFVWRLHGSPTKVERPLCSPPIIQHRSCADRRHPHPATGQRWQFCEWPAIRVAPETSIFPG